jgi:transcriptional regulator with XRE-family HTH domain
MLQFKDNRLVKFGKHITDLRKEKGMEPIDITKKCGLSLKDVIAIEKGDKNFGFTTFLELAKGLDMLPENLLRVDLSK